MSCGLDTKWWLLVTRCELAMRAVVHHQLLQLVHCGNRYGSSANLVLTTGHGVNGYTLDNALGEFILTHPDVGLLLRLPQFTSFRVLVASQLAFCQRLLQSVRSMLVFVLLPFSRPACAIASVDVFDTNFQLLHCRSGFLRAARSTRVSLCAIDSFPLLLFALVPRDFRAAAAEYSRRLILHTVNEGNSKYFYPPVVNYLNSIKYPADEKKSPYSARYIGSMVADVHRTLLYGGIFGYPNDKKSKSGKLRLLYEAFPMAFLTEQAGALCCG